MREFSSCEDIGYYHMRIKVEVPVGILESVVAAVSNSTPVLVL